jgi:alpha-glucosidase
MAGKLKGTAAGSLYVDNGVSIVQEKTTSMEMQIAEGKLSVNSFFAYNVRVKVANVAFLGIENQLMPVAIMIYLGKEHHSQLL